MAWVFGPFTWTTRRGTRVTVFGFGVLLPVLTVLSSSLLFKTTPETPRPLPEIGTASPGGDDTAFH